MRPLTTLLYASYEMIKTYNAQLDAQKKTIGDSQIHLL